MNRRSFLALLPLAAALPKRLAKREPEVGFYFARYQVDPDVDRCEYVPGAYNWEWKTYVYDAHAPRFRIDPETRTVTRVRLE